MGSLDRQRRGTTQAPDAEPGPEEDGPVDATQEARLWTILREDPNDVEAFAQLADVVRRHASEGHQGGDPQRAADDAVWALAEELAHSGRAWYPLIELARLSVHDDREAALRRLATAAERDPGGRALATGLQMLRDAGLPDEALGLGVGHWRPREHDVEAGRQLVEAAVEAGRKADARRHLDALSLHPDVGRVQQLRVELERRIAEAEQLRSGSMPVVDVREPAEPPKPQPPKESGGLGLLRAFRRR